MTEGTEKITENNLIQKQKDTTLFELILGTLPFGLLCQLIGSFFVKDIWDYSLGLWIGIVIAMVLSWHMWFSLNKAMGIPESAVKMMTASNLIRYGVIVGVLFTIMFTEIANPLAAFLGIMGLKVSAYIQPFTHKAIQFFIEQKKQRR